MTDNHIEVLPRSVSKRFGALYVFDYSDKSEFNRSFVFLQYREQTPQAQHRGHMSAVFKIPEILVRRRDTVIIVFDDATRIIVIALQYIERHLVFCIVFERLCKAIADQIDFVRRDKAFRVVGQNSAKLWQCVVRIEPHGRKNAEIRIENGLLPPKLPAKMKLIAVFFFFFLIYRKDSFYIGFPQITVIRIKKRLR